MRSAVIEVSVKNGKVFAGSRGLKINDWRVEEDEHFYRGTYKNKPKRVADLRLD